MLNVLSDEMGQLNGTKPGPQGLWHAEADAVHCCEKAFGCEWVETIALLAT